MRLHPRNLVESFSTFLKISEDEFGDWIIVPQLDKSMRDELDNQTKSPVSLQQDSPTDFTKEAQNFWSNFWYEHWKCQSHNLAEQHLLAYLQESCYWATEKVMRRVPQSSSAYTKTGYFQIAVSESPFALKKFNPEKSNNLKGFAQMFLGDRLKSLIKQQQIADICTPWGLIRKTSTKRLKDVLVAQGLSKQEVLHYRLLLQGFKELHTHPCHRGERTLPEPDEQLWQAVAEYYNQQRHTWLPSSCPAVDSSTAKKQITETTAWIRQFLYPAIESLNQPCFVNEESKQDELQDQLRYSSQEESLLDELILMEERDDLQHALEYLQQLIFHTFLKLDEETRQMMCLYYCKKLSQQEIMELMKMSQPTISRRLRRGRKVLLEAIQVGLREKLNKFPDLDELNGVMSYLQEFLNIYLEKSDLCI